MPKTYTIFLDNQMIGSTHFEKADPPMGVVFGRIQGETQIINYQFFKELAIKHQLDLDFDHPDNKLLSIQDIKILVVKNETGMEIKGEGNEISGMDSEGFEITIVGIPYPFYGEEFPHHVAAYQ